MPGDDDDDGDLDTLPLGIVRTAMDVMNIWRNCHRPACKRGRACRGRHVQCADERPPSTPSVNPEKDKRDKARAMAIFRRVLSERMALNVEAEPASPAVTRPRAASRKPRQSSRVKAAGPDS